MDFLINDLSLHGQFSDVASFRIAIQQVMTIRQVTRRFGRELHCDRNLLRSQVTIDKTMQQVIQALSKDERGALIQWLTRHGPFWDDLRRHGVDDWIECNGEIVTDRAIGEAAWCCLNGIARGIVSITPSRWQFSPVPVVWMVEQTGAKSVEIVNHWDPTAFENFVKALPVAL